MLTKTEILLPLNPHSREFWKMYFREMESISWSKVWNSGMYGEQNKKCKYVEKSKIVTL